MNKTIRLLDVLFSQALCFTLLTDWARILFHDLALGHVFTSRERGSSLLLGVAVALLLRLSFGRWRLFRLMARVTLVITVAHIFIPFDWMEAVTVLLATFAVLLDVVVLTGPCEPEWVVRRRSPAHRRSVRAGDCMEVDRNFPVANEAQGACLSVGEEKACIGKESCGPGVTSTLRGSSSTAEDGIATQGFGSVASSNPLVEDGATDSVWLDNDELKPVTSDVVASHIRVQLRMMTGDTFAISRYVMQYTVSALEDMSAADIDVALRRIVWAAALRRSREEGATITLEDVRAGIRSISHGPA